MNRIALFFALALSATGCLDSIVDNPCEDGYFLSDEGECVFDYEKTPPNTQTSIDPPPRRSCPTSTTTATPPADPTKSNIQNDELVIENNVPRYPDAHLTPLTGCSSGARPQLDPIQ